MKTFALWTLVAVNAALIVTVGSRLFREDRADAQAAAASGRDDYLMIPGEIVGGNNAIVYVIDETTHQLSSMSYDDAMRKLVTMSPRNLDRDFISVGQNGSNAPRHR